MLARLRMSIADSKKTYKELSTKVFRTSWRPWRWGWVRWTAAVGGMQSAYPAEPLEDEIRKIVSAHLQQERQQGRSTTPLKAPLDASFVRCFVCATVDGQMSCERLRTYSIAEESSIEPVWTITEAGRATSAAPLYFPSLEKNGRRYYDGGMRSNNPILEAAREVKAHFNEFPVAAIVSIGNGASALKPLGNLKNVFDHFSSRVTDTEEAWEDFQKEFPDFQKISMRFQELDKLGKIDLAAANELDKIERISREYLKKPKVQTQLKQCATLLLSV